MNKIEKAYELKSVSSDSIISFQTCSFSQNAKLNCNEINYFWKGFFFTISYFCRVNTLAIRLRYIYTRCSVSTWRKAYCDILVLFYSSRSCAIEGQKLKNILFYVWQMITWILLKLAVNLLLSKTHVLIKESSLWLRKNEKFLTFLVQKLLELYI